VDVNRPSYYRLLIVLRTATREEESIIQLLRKVHNIHECVKHKCRNFLTLSNAHKQNVVDKYVTSCIILPSKVRPRPELVKKFSAFEQLELSSPRSQKVKVK
jgi:hypothetical protein